MNKAMIIGNLTRDPEVNTTASGISVCRFTVAVTRPFKRDETDFISCVAWRKSAEIISQYVKKGNKIAITGYIQTGSYEKDGTRRYTTDLIVEDFEFLTPKGQGGGTSQDTPPPPKESGIFEDEKRDFEPLDDEQMPF
jgi:single-strand DNA-binding protein